VNIRAFPAFLQDEWGVRAAGSSAMRTAALGERDATAADHAEQRELRLVTAQRMRGNERRQCQ
jgi:hypothetical protein